MMPEKRAKQRALRARRQGKSPSTQAGEFIREEIRHIREGKHGARSTKQIIAIGLSQARRAGVPLKPPAKSKVSAKTYRSAKSAYQKGQSHAPISRTRSIARMKALKHESGSAASHRELSRHAISASKKRSSAEKSRAARKAAKTRARNSNQR
jgi:hypothetical protein